MGGNEKNRKQDKTVFRINLRTIQPYFVKLSETRHCELRRSVAI